MTQLRSVTCHMGSYSVTCYPTQVNTPRLNPMQAGTRFTYPGGMEGWVDLVDLIALQLGVEPTTFRSRVRRPTTAPPRQPINDGGDDDDDVLSVITECRRNGRITSWHGTSRNTATYRASELHRMISGLRTFCCITGARPAAIRTL